MEQKRRTDLARSTGFGVGFRGRRFERLGRAEDVDERPPGVGVVADGALAPLLRLLEERRRREPRVVAARGGDEARRRVERVLVVGL